MEGQSSRQRPLLQLGALESYQLVWSDEHILQQLKITIAEDPTLEPVLAILKKIHTKFQGISTASLKLTLLMMGSFGSKISYMYRMTRSFGDKF